MEAARNRGRGLTVRPAHLLTLDHPGALRVDIVGAKAAHLATARRRHLPALPGWVVPITESRPALQAGSAALAEGSIPRARRAATSVVIDGALMTDLARVGEPGARLVVRSSTLLDDDPSWSGAFASYADITPAEIATAVRGCWASVFAPDALERLSLVGSSAGDVGMAVLIQPQVTPTAGGWARASVEWVEVAAVKGHPGPLLHGVESGAQLRVHRDGRLEGSPRLMPIDASAVNAVAGLMRRAEGELGATSIEWAIVDGRPVIFQVNLGPPGPEPSVETPEVFAEPAYARLAVLLVGRRGRLADWLVAPWAAAAPACSPADSVGSPADLFERAEAIAAELEREVAAAAGVTPGELVESLARHDIPVALRVSGLTIPDARPSRVLGAVEQVARSLVNAGRLSEVAAIWWQSPGWVREALRGGSSPTPAARLVGDRWGDALFGAVAANGSRVPGMAVSDGRAVGRAAWVRGGDDVGRVRSGEILVTARPLHSLAPLLWKVAGVVTMVGSPGAHLFEVARSLRIPAVVAASARTVPGGAICAVDSRLGEIRVWQP